MSTIPASHIVTIIPGVVAAGGTALILNGLFLTQSSRVPIGVVQSFASALSVANTFGPVSTEAAFATVYFNGFINCTKLPSAMLFSQYNGATAVAAWQRSGNILAVGLAALQLITTGSLNLIVDGYTHNIAALNLSSATSFSAAAALINSGLSNPSLATVTGSVATNVLTVTAVSSGTLSVGQTISGGTIPAGTTIVALGSGTGLTGTYTVSASFTQTSITITASATPCVVTFDAQQGVFLVTSGITGVASGAAYATGTLAATLLFTSATGSVLSQGAAATTPTPFMNNLTNLGSQNWATFTTVFDPDFGSGNAQKLLFAVWTNNQQSRYAYVAWEVDLAPTVAAPALTSLGFLIQQNAYTGTCLVHELGTIDLAPFVMGFAASIDFGAHNGRATLAFKGQSGLSASASDLQSAQNLISNGYNYYGAYATANQNFLFMYPGSISGPFLWFDSYINQIWLNNALQLAFLQLLLFVKSIPYNDAGNALLEAAAMDPINNAINFGAIRVGVTLSVAQAAQINNSVGKIIDATLSQRGWYLDIQPATPQTRAARQSPPMTLYYMDGQSVQQITLSSLDVL